MIGAHGRVEARWTELTGLQPAPTEDVANDVTPGRLYFVGEGVRRPVPLHPLVLAPAKGDGVAFGFLNEVSLKEEGAAVRRVEYLDYETGAPQARVDAAEALTALIGRLRGQGVDAEAVAATIAAVAATRVRREEEDAPVPPTVPSPPFDVPPVIAGKYRILSKIGEGGMGAVYAAEHIELKQLVAIKVLLPALAANEEIVGRFQQEARQAALTRHPGIVQVFDLGRTDDDRPFLVMDLLRGEGVGDRLTYGPLPVDEALWIATEALETLMAVHARGIVHRDIKPDNLFVTYGEHGKRVVKLLDFGIAKVREATWGATRTGALMGTLQFMSPEQMTNTATVDARADIYAIGATLYCLLTGQPPAIGGGGQDLRNRRAEVPEGLARAVEKALEPQADDRFASAQAMKAALEESAAGVAAYAKTVLGDALDLPPQRPEENAGNAPLPGPSEGEGSPRPPPASRGSRSRRIVGLLAALGLGALGAALAARSISKAPDLSAAPVASTASPSATPPSAMPERMIPHEGGVVVVGSTEAEAKAALAECAAVLPADTCRVWNRTRGAVAPRAGLALLDGRGGGHQRGVRCVAQ